ncbi:uncharacterized protein LOC129605987 [Condylostylus longicornis]|uniref:uncharacterized protein LOC129605987 n=1 Tax=Condylostylus longicornis TaxID=2530218 RepID=UPI00244DE8EF|nr:uncharacterized protein LOC129605987 [Condylostylus longicornis]
MELTSEQVTKSTSEQSNSSENISQTSTEVNIENTEFIDETTKDIFISSADNNQFTFESVTQMDSKPDNIKFRTQSYYKSFSNSLSGRPQFRQVGQFNDGKSYVLTENIKSSLVETVLTVIIEDINDNKPIFEYPPPDTKFVIGYPDVEVSNNILPQYLIKVNATDLDIGLNALIRYKLDNPDFGIDEETGIIYPYSGAMENSNEISLTVYAVDRNGEMEGSLNSSVKIIVKKIHSYQLILLEFQGNQMENVDELLNEVSKNKGFDLIPLKWATVPNLTATNKQSLLHQMIARIHRIFGPAYSQKTTLKVWTYAINENADFVKSDKIIEKLSGSSDVIAASYEDTVKYADASRDVTAFIVGIVILSVICIGCLGFISWVVYFRKALYEKTSSTSRSEVSSFAASLETNSTEPEKDSSTQSSNNVKRDTMKIAGTTTQETSDYQTRMLELLNDRNHKENDDNYENNSGNENFECDEEGTIPNGDIGGERRKSVVKFNELVERIEIEDRRGSQNSGISSERL